MQTACGPPGALRHPAGSASRSVPAAVQRPPQDGAARRPTHPLSESQHCTLRWRSAAKRPGDDKPDPVTAPQPASDRCSTASCRWPSRRSVSSLRLGSVASVTWVSAGSAAAGGARAQARAPGAHGHWLPTADRPPWGGLGRADPPMFHCSKPCSRPAHLHACTSEWPLGPPPTLLALAIQAQQALQRRIRQLAAVRHGQPRQLRSISQLDASGGELAQAAGGGGPQHRRVGTRVRWEAAGGREGAGGGGGRRRPGASQISALARNLVLGCIWDPLPC